MPSPITCPCCKASNDAATCRRCKADLSLLVAVADRQGFLLSRARTEAAEGKFADALRSLDEAESLLGGADVRQARAAVLLLSGEFSAAWAVYHEATAVSRPG
ncbi:MAG: hypothetical protein U0871_02905 [Gemmataceae bacterium]